MDIQPSQAWLIEIPAKAMAKTVRNQWQEYINDCESEKGLVTPSVATKLLGVHRSRVHQLMDAGKLVRFEHFGHSWLSCAQLMDRLQEQPRAGRPLGS